MRHLSQTIMWVGGYDDWTPAEQLEWDRDLKEIFEDEGRHCKDMKHSATNIVNCEKVFN